MTRIERMVVFFLGKFKEFLKILFGKQNKIKFGGVL